MTRGPRVASMRSVIRYRIVTDTPKHRGRMARLVVGVLLAVVVALAACGDDDGTVDASQVEKGIEQSLAARGIDGATVNCPDPVRVQPGTTVTCPVSGAGGSVGTVSFEFTSSGSIDQSSVQTGA
jgi:Domain of unknown function (DUF4333)